MLAPNKYTYLRVSEIHWASSDVVRLKCLPLSVEVEGRQQYVKVLLLLQILSGGRQRRNLIDLRKICPVHLRDRIFTHNLCNLASSANILNLNNYPWLYLVTMMMHNSYGGMNPIGPWMTDVKWCMGFLKEFNNVTAIQVDNQFVANGSKIVRLFGEVLVLIIVPLCLTTLISDNASSALVSQFCTQSVFTTIYFLFSSQMIYQIYGAQAKRRL